LLILFAPSRLEPVVTLTATFSLTNTYFVGSPSQATVKVHASDEPTNAVVANLNVPVGIDYHSPSNSLIVAINYPTGETNNFARIATNGAVSSWTTLHGMGDANTEIKLTTVKTSTNGWTVGDMYFGTGQPGIIGKISASGSTVLTNWATLTNAASQIRETNFLGGSLYIDQTGVFGGDMIVVTGGSTNSPEDGGTVWRVTAATNATRIAQIDNPTGAGRKLEGVLTLPNDVAKYGPWAGKIVIGGESFGVVFAVDTNGTVTPYNLGMAVLEDVRLIPSGQNLYCLDVTGNQVLKIPSNYFTGFAGDVLLVDEGTGGVVASVFIVHWDGGRFVVRQIVTGTSSLEHVVFAPINIPALP
jgi:hypothetical protein